MAKRDGLADMIGDFIGDIIGWAFCLAILSAFYILGFAVAKWIGLGEHRESAGLLSAITWVWMYEHRRANERWARQFNQ
jgi:hypothetical protein